MRNLLLLALISLCILSACNSKNNEFSATETSSKNGEYFEFYIDEKTFTLTKDDVLTTYNEFGKVSEFKIYAGKEGEPSLTLTIPANMGKPSSTPSGSDEAGSSIAQGSVSLQGYPEKGLTYNNFDFLANPPLVPVADAIIITSSEAVGEESRIITGTINTTTIPGADADAKAYVIKGKFRIEHTFSGYKF